MPTPKVLLVDDVNMFLELEKSFLKLSPVKVLLARDGAEALEVVRNERPDLVFMDLHMPKMSGAECCAAIKGDSLLKAIPVVIITTAGKEEDRQLCFNAGCDDFLSKPVERKSFLEMARKYLQNIERRELRASCSLPVTIVSRFGTITGEALNISEKGLFVATPELLQAGSALDVTVVITPDRPPVESKGRLVWVNTGTERRKPSLPDGFGIEFVAIRDEHVETIRALVDRQHPRG
jgi:CheY-like chemotaxis protein/Tfp pilus assembly protein PilZ